MPADAHAPQTLKLAFQRLAQVWIIENVCETQSNVSFEVGFEAADQFLDMSSVDRKACATVTPRGLLALSPVFRVLRTPWELDMFRRLRLIYMSNFKRVVGSITTLRLIVLFVLVESAFGQITGAGAADAISRLNTARGDSRIGNSVDTGTGSYLLSKQVISVMGSRSIAFSLTYNSLLTGNRGETGYGWSHNYETFIDGSPTGTVTLHWDANFKNSFQFSGSDSNGSRYDGLDEAVRYDRLTRATNNTWTFTRMDGSVFRFNASGKLTSVANKIGQVISLFTPTGAQRVSSLNDANSTRSLSLRYTRDGSGLVQAVLDQEDRVVHFQYNADRVQVIRGPVTLDPLGYGAPFVPKTIPDNNPAGVTHTIQVDRTAPIGLVELELANISHQRPSDLRVVVTSPSGTQVSTQNPVPDPTTSSPNPWALDGMVLAAFDGENPSGQWSVRVIDSVSGSTGTLNGWRLRFTEATDPVSFAYDGSGRLTASFGPGAEQLFSNVYDALGRVVIQDDGVNTNQSATFSYADTPSGGVRTTYRDRTGAVHVFEHDARYHLLQYTNPLGSTNLYTYSAEGARTRLTDALGRNTIFNYDADGNLITLVDAAGFVTTFDYDQRNNLVAVRDALGKQSSFTYNSDNNLTRVTDALGHQDQKSYGGSRGMTGNILQDGAGINYAYTNGMPISASHPVSGTARTQYDNAGRPTQLVDADGYISYMTYDSKGNVIRETDALGESIQHTYDRRNRLILKRDRKGYITRYDYDNNGNIVAVTNPVGQTVTFLYDGEDRQIKAVGPTGAHTDIHYDSAGQIVAEVDTLGNRMTYQYDAAGNRIAVFDAEGTKIQQTTYDARNLPISEGDAFGNTSLSSYDALGRLTQTTDPLQRSVRFTYDALDRLIEARDPLNRVSRKNYATDDVVTSLVNPQNASTAFNYDAANRIRQVVTPTGQRTTFTYNGRDLIRTETKPSGTVFTYTYNEVGRLTRMTPAGSSIVPETLFEYDANGNLTTVSRKAFADVNPVPRLRRSYDALDRMTSYIDSAGNTIQFRYDAAGNMGELVYPDGKSVLYGYDAANRMTSVRDWNGRVTNYTYDSNSRVTRIDFPNKTYRTMEYDITGRIVHRTDVDSRGAIVIEYRFSYDKAGQLDLEQSIPANPATPPPPANMSFDNDNRLSVFNGQQVNFDADGNLTRGPLGSAFADYRYDPAGNLAQAGQQFYTYDEEDRLIAMTVSGQTTRFVVNPGSTLSQVLMRTAPNGQITRYVYGIGLLYEEINGAQTRTMHYDQRGNTLALSADDGIVVGTLEYGPYGEVVRTSGQTDTMFRFGGMFGVISDPQGLNYMRYRWYSPAVRRFLTADAHYGDIDDAGSLNRYAYAGNNPAVRVDPDGEFWHIIAGAIGGAVVGTVVKMATDLLNDGKINSPWQEYVGAALGGAVTGGLVAACPTCGLVSGFAFGALGGAVGNATTQGLKLATGEQQQFDLVDFGVEVGISGAFGLLPAGRGAKAAIRPQGFKAGLKRSAKDAFRFKFRLRQYKRVTIADNVKVPTLEGTVPVAVARKVRVPITPRDAFRDVFADPKLILDVIANVGQDLLIGHVSNAGGRKTTETQSLGEVNGGQRATFGEFAHWQLWLDALGLAARPIPNNPNNPLAAF